jgi:hypothetical protein
MPTEFVFELRADRYHRNLGWQCSALALPAASVAKLIIDGSELDPTLYRVTGTHIRLVNPPSPMPSGAAHLEIKKKLVTIDTAVVVALLGLVGTIASGWLSYESGKREVPEDTGGIQPPVPVVAASTTSVPNRQEPEVNPPPKQGAHVGGNGTVTQVGGSVSAAGDASVKIGTQE